MNKISTLAVFLVWLYSDIVYAVEKDSLGINPFRKHEIGIQCNPVFYNNINAFTEGFHHTIYSLKYGNNFKQWLYLGIEVNYISRKASFINYPMKSHTIIPELYAEFNLLSTKNKNVLFFIEANAGYYYMKWSGYMSWINTSSSPCPCFYEFTEKKIIYFLTPGIRFYLLPDELDRRLSLDLMCKLSAKKDFLVNNNYYVPSFKFNYHFNKIRFRFSTK